MYPKSNRSIRAIRNVHLIEIVYSQYNIYFRQICNVLYAYACVLMKLVVAKKAVK